VYEDPAPFVPVKVEELMVILNNDDDAIPLKRVYIINPR
jgi:hypothetical protein